MNTLHTRFATTYLRLWSWSMLPAGSDLAALDSSGAARRLRGLTLAALIATLLLAVPPLMAFVTPATGSFGYDIYDVVVNQILNGPIGFVGGVALIIWGATKVMANWMITILCVISGTVIIKAQTLLTSLGAIVQ